VRYIPVPDDVVKYIMLAFSDETPDATVDIIRTFTHGVMEYLNVALKEAQTIGRYIERGLDIQTIYNNYDMTGWIRDYALPFLDGKGLDVCCGKYKIKPDAIGVDNESEFGEETVAEEIRDATDLRGLEGQDYVFSAHGLEHIPDWEKALTEWCRVLNRGGILFLYLPNPVVYPPNSKEFEKRHVNDFSAEQIVKFLESIGMKIVEYEPEHDKYASFHVVATKW
jgi:SAM-dependent methyltransferase